MERRRHVLDSRLYADAMLRAQKRRPKGRLFEFAEVRSIQVERLRQFKAHRRLGRESDFAISG
jgi:hypothetical protein